MSLKSYEDILHVRDAARDEFGRFRTAVRRYASLLESQPYEPDFAQELERLVASEINPSIADLHAKLKSSRDKVLQRVVQKSQSKEALVPFAIGMFANLSLPWTLAVSAAVIGLDVALEQYFDRRQIREANGLSYLMNFTSGEL